MKAQLANYCHRLGKIFQIDTVIRTIRSRAYIDYFLLQGDYGKEDGVINKVGQNRSTEFVMLLE